MPFNGPLCILMKTIVEKRYALPNRVIDGVVEFLVKFVLETKTLPVVWHQLVLKFCEFYSGKDNSFRTFQKTLHMFLILVFNFLDTFYQ
jgi:hypothetical protein